MRISRVQATLDIQLTSDEYVEVARHLGVKSPFTVGNRLRCSAYVHGPNSIALVFGSGNVFFCSNSKLSTDGPMRVSFSAKNIGVGGWSTFGLTEVVNLNWTKPNTLELELPEVPLRATPITFSKRLSQRRDTGMKRRQFSEPKLGGKGTPEYQQAMDERASRGAVAVPVSEAPSVAPIPSIEDLRRIKTEFNRAVQAGLEAKFDSEGQIVSFVVEIS